MADSDGFGDRPWRVGRKVGRTIYDRHDQLIGVMDTRSLAAEVVRAVNAQAGRRVPMCPIHDVPLSGGDQCPTCFTQPVPGGG